MTFLMMFLIKLFHTRKQPITAKEKKAQHVEDAYTQGGTRMLCAIALYVIYIGL